jgi:uncharacterized protein
MAILIGIDTVLRTLMCGAETPNQNSERGKPARGVSVLLAVYKATLSPLFFALGARCRYVPPCSEYAAMAASRYGVWGGAWMALARLARCHPLGGPGGLDPVPAERPGARWYMPWRYGVWRHLSDGGDS